MFEESTMCSMGLLNNENCNWSSSARKTAFATFCESCLLVVLLFCSRVGWAQLSPGDLAQPHAHLEGLSNCTKCHNLGESVSSQKCLDCHKEIKTLVDQNRGYHASQEVRRQECFDCHSDHHGRRFQMVRFDEKNFNHKLTGFELTGAHKRIDCRECHKPDFIDDADLRKRRNTWLGLGTACLDCHDDYHQGTLSNDCAKCHDTEAFRPAPKFSHDKTRFPLTGKHKQVDCASCHQVETRNGKEFQRFADLPFNNCNACHQDAHRGNLGNNCKQCHSDAGWDVLTSLRNFNHNTTGFPLKGRHQRVDCFSCHTPDATAATVFQDRLGIAPSACAQCHEDVHQGRFGSDCTQCHNENSWKFAGDPERFDHDMTDFPLEGKHATVDCAKCHTSGRYTDPLPFARCTDCHEDYHKGAFTVGKLVRDCADCHDVAGFAPSTFDIDDHNRSEFPLEGAHMATPCIACHLPDPPGGNEWRFNGLGTRCIDCHDDVHAGQLDPRWYPQQDCQQCHSPESWVSGMRFDHNQTDFALEGAHARAACSACHTRDETTPYGRFKDLDTDCVACHENVHGRQFEQRGGTDCQRCHDFESWRLPDFDHSRTKFPLVGKHAEVACDACHKEKFIDGALRVEYKIPSFQCIDCHGGD